MKHMIRSALDGIERAELYRQSVKKPFTPPLMSPFLDKLKFELFYTVKLLIPRPLQIQIRRFLVRWKMPSVRHVWPIHEEAGNWPANWPGWPEGKEFALVLTHDVESARGLDRCERVAEIEKKHGFRSSFNFVVGDYAVPRDLRRVLERDGFEIGIHGLHHEGNLFFTRKRFTRHALSINRFLGEWKCGGFRAPSMFRNLDWIRELDIEYDLSSFDTDPFEPQPEGVGTIFPFIVQKKASHRPFVELPYTLPQDFLVFILLQDQDGDIWKKKLDWIAQKKGMALLITHPDYMCFGGESRYDEYPAEKYSEFLDHVNANYAGRFLNPLPADVARQVMNAGTAGRRRTCP